MSGLSFDTKVAAPKKSTLKANPYNAKTDFDLTVKDVSKNITPQEVVDYSVADINDLVNNANNQTQNQQQNTQTQNQQQNNSDTPWWQYAVAGYTGFVSIFSRILESTTDAFVNWGTQMNSGAWFLLGSITGNDTYTQIGNKVQEGAMDFIKKDYTKDIRNAQLSVLGVTDPDVYKVGEDAEGVASSINKTILKNAPGQWRFLGAGILAHLETGEEVQYAYQRGATYWEGALSAHNVAGADMIQYGVMGGKNYSGASWSAGKSFVADVEKEGVRYLLYDYRNYGNGERSWEGLQEVMQEKGPNIILDAAMSAAGSKIKNGVASKIFKGGWGSLKPVVHDWVNSIFGH